MGFPPLVLHRWLATPPSASAYDRAVVPIVPGGRPRHASNRRRSRPTAQRREDDEHSHRQESPMTAIISRFGLTFDHSGFILGSNSFSAMILWRSRLALGLMGITLLCGKPSVATKSVEW